MPPIIAVVPTIMTTESSLNNPAASINIPPRMIDIFETRVIFQHRSRDCARPSIRSSRSEISSRRSLSSIRECLPALQPGASLRNEALHRSFQWFLAASVRGTLAAACVVLSDLLRGQCRCVQEASQRQSRHQIGQFIHERFIDGDTERRLRKQLSVADEHTALSHEPDRAAQGGALRGICRLKMADKVDYGRQVRSRIGRHEFSKNLGGMHALPAEHPNVTTDIIAE